MRRCSGGRSRRCAPGLRVTLQRANYRQLPAFVELAKALGARQVSFLAVDIANPHAFGRLDNYDSDLALRDEDLPVFEQLLDSLEHDHVGDFNSGFHRRESTETAAPTALFCRRSRARRLSAGPLQRAAIFRSHRREWSVQPCFFIRGPGPAPDARRPSSVLNGAG